MRLLPRFSRDDEQSMALTIVSVIDRVRPIEAQQMFKFLFGDHSERYALAMQLVDALVRQNVLKDRHPNLIVTVIAQLLERQYTWAHHRSSNVNLDSLAKLYHMNKQRFKRDYVRPLEETMRIWQDTSTRDITEQLLAKGVLK